MKYPMMIQELGEHESRNNLLGIFWFQHQT